MTCDTITVKLLRPQENKFDDALKRILQGTSRMYLLLQAHNSLYFTCFFSMRDLHPRMMADRPWSGMTLISFMRPTCLRRLQSHRTDARSRKTALQQLVVDVQHKRSSFHIFITEQHRLLWMSKALSQQNSVLLKSSDTCRCQLRI